MSASRQCAVGSKESSCLLHLPSAPALPPAPAVCPCAFFPLDSLGMKGVTCSLDYLGRAF